MHPPGVEPGARPWEDPMLPLHHECLAKVLISIAIVTSPLLQSVAVLVLHDAAHKLRIFGGKWHESQTYKRTFVPGPIRASISCGICD